jgi:hypothetical protein
VSPISTFIWHVHPESDAVSYAVNLNLDGLGISDLFQINCYFGAVNGCRSSASFDRSSTAVTKPLAEEMGVVKVVTIWYSLFAPPLRHSMPGAPFKGKSISKAPAAPCTFRERMRTGHRSR